MLEPGKSGCRALRKGRHSQPNGCYFITVVTVQRIPWFQIFAFAHAMCRELQGSRTIGDAENLCWVLMPDHLHLLLRLRERPLNRVVQQLKSRTALRLNQEIGRSGRFWEPAYYDHALRSEESLRRTARYIVANPLRAGLVGKVGDYPYWNAKWL